MFCCMDILLSSSVDVHLGCFYFLAVMNNAAVDIHVQVFAWPHTFMFLGVKLPGHLVTLTI